MSSTPFAMTRPVNCCQRITNPCHLPSSSLTDRGGSSNNTGTPDDLTQLHDDLVGSDMGLILDIVPNHMAARSGLIVLVSTTS